LKRITLCPGGAFCARFLAVSESIDHPIKYSWNQQQPYTLLPPRRALTFVVAQNIYKYRGRVLQYKKRSKSFSGSAQFVFACVFPMRLLLFMGLCIVVALRVYRPNGLLSCPDAPSRIDFRLIRIAKRWRAENFDA
jgi:hypothetical protein